MMAARIPGGWPFRPGYPGTPSQEVILTVWGVRMSLSRSLKKKTVVHDTANT